MGAVARRLLVVIPLLMAMLLVAPASRPGVPRAAAQDEVAIEIQDFQFSPDTVEVPVGTTVTWTNNGDAPHTVTSDDGVFDSGELGNGDTFSFTFDEAGEFAYHCDIHKRMTATIVVVEAQEEATAESGDDDAAEGEAVEIQDFQFSPDTLEIPVGTTVTWTNGGEAPHTATADDGSFDTGRIEPGESASVTFDEAGEFAYHCDVHPRMTATIVVTDEGGEATEEATEEPTEEPIEQATEEPTEEPTDEATPVPSGPSTIVGGATDGNNALEYVGQLDQRGTDLTIYGYLTRIAGLDAAALFTDADPTNWNEGTARFTFFGSAQLTSRATIDEQVIATTAEGSLTFFINDNGGGSFELPESFLSGTQIATADVRVHNVLSVYETAKGIANGDAALVWTSETPFALDGQNYELGKVDGKHRLTFNGLGTLDDPDEPRSTFLMAGSSISIAAPAPSGTAEATPEAGDDDDDANANELTIDLGELNDSGMSGTATLRANGDQTDVEVSLDGATGGHPAHIHSGTCTDLDPNPAYPLTEIDADGKSTTTVDISLEDLQAEPFAINIHKSADEIGVYVACGEITS
jgi:plastocyanin